MLFEREENITKTARQWLTTVALHKPRHQYELYEVPNTKDLIKIHKTNKFITAFTKQRCPNLALISSVNVQNRTMWHSDNALALYQGDAGCLVQVLRAFLQSPQVTVGIICYSGHDHFLPNPFRFVISLSAYHLTPCSLDIDNCVK